MAGLLIATWGLAVCIGWQDALEQEARNVLAREQAGWVYPLED